MHSDSHATSDGPLTEGSDALQASADAFAESLDVNLIAMSERPSNRPKTPPDIPAYSIQRFVASGGQGNVWLATRVADKARVAIKVMHHHWPDDTKARARFEQSYELLHALNHPGIVRPLDRGTLPTGELWYATDYISGKKLDAYIESLTSPFLASGQTKLARNFPLKPVLELFVRICDAVQAAHSATILHRDLKPSNVLIDVHGNPHIVDFGVAKDLSLPTSEAITITSELVGTPCWASPEQLDGSAGLIGTRSDIYSVGVVLYQLVVERFPYEVEGPLPRVFDHIRHVEPTPPTTLVTWVDRDLQAIMLKALRKRPEERYQAIGDLKADLERYLRGEPVVARGDGLWYQTWTFIRQYRLPVSFAAAVLILTVAYAISVTNLYRRADRNAVDARAKFAIAWNMAELLVSQIDNELVNLPGSTESRRRMLNMAAAHLDQFNQERSNDPALLADLATAQSRLADVAGSLAEGDKALHHAEAALSLRRRIVELQPRSPEAQAALSIAVVRVGDFSKGLGDFTRCRACYEEAMAIDERLAREHPEATTYSDNLCWSYERNGTLAADLADCSRLLDFSERRLTLARRLAENEPNVSMRAFGLAAALVERNAAESRCVANYDRSAADRRLEEAFEISRRLVAAEPNRLQFITALMFRSSDMAGVAQRNGDLALARQRHNDARTTARRLMDLEPNQPAWRWHVATFDSYEAKYLRDAGNLAEAEALYRRAYAEAVALATTLSYSPSRDSIIFWGDELCELLIAAGREKEAHEIAAETYRLSREFRDSSESTPNSLAYLAQSLLTPRFTEFRDPPSALMYAERAAKVSRKPSGPILLILAEARLANGDHPGCRAAIERAMAVWTPGDEQFRERLVEVETALVGNRPVESPKR